MRGARPVGGPGAVTSGIIADELLGGELPALLRVVILKEYVLALVKPYTVAVTRFPEESVTDEAGAVTDEAGAVMDCGAVPAVIFVYVIV